MNEKFTPLTPAELDELTEHMTRNPGLYGDNIHRLLLTHQLLSQSYAVSEAARAGHLKLIQDMADMLKAGDASDGHHTHKELYEYRLLYHAYAALGLYAAGYTVIRSWKHHDGEDCFGGGWFIVVMYVPAPDGSEVQVTNHYPAEAWDLFDQIPELPESLPWDGHTPAEASQRLREGIALALPTFLNLKYDSERVASVETDLSWALSELGHEHWQECHTTDDGCYQCDGYLELKEKYKDA